MQRKTRSAGKSQTLIFKFTKSGNKTNIFDINHYLGTYNTTKPQKIYHFLTTTSNDKAQKTAKLSKKSEIRTLTLRPCDVKITQTNKKTMTFSSN